MTIINCKNYISIINKKITKVCKSSYQGVRQLFERTPDKDYFLLSKNEKMPLSKLPDDSWIIPNGSGMFTSVKVGKKSNENYLKEIVTFYDKKNRPITKYFSESGILKKRHKYSYGETFNKNSLLIKLKNIKREECVQDNSLINTYGNHPKIISMLGKWNLKSEETQYIVPFPNMPHTGNVAKKLTIRKTIFKSDESKTLTLTEYPTNFNIENKNSIKHLKIVVGNEAGLPIKEYDVQNLKFPTSDKFLQYRLLEPIEKCKELTKYYLKTHNLNNLGINIEIPSRKISEDAAASFSSYDRTIRWKRVPDYRSIPAIAAHESEHAYQHSQIGRVKPKTSFEYDCQYKFGKITNSKELIEAKKYTNASNTYPLKTDPDYPKKHDDNYLEIKATEAEKAAEIDYSIGQYALKSIFKYVPDTINTF